MSAHQRQLPSPFGEILYTHRRHAGWTQEELAARVEGINAETISRYERGVREPRVSRLLHIARALDISPAHLLPQTPQDDTELTWEHAVYNALMRHGPFTPSEAEVLTEILVSVAEKIPRLRER